jgi:hypothetical protein
LAVRVENSRSRRGVRVVVVFLAAVVVLAVVWLALQTLGGKSSKQGMPAAFSLTF